VLDGNCALGCWCETECLCFTLSVLWAVGLEAMGFFWSVLCCSLRVWKRLVCLDGICVLGCVSGTNWLCFAVTVLYALGLEWIVYFGMLLICRLWVWN
jgi:hypothetical protein